MKPNDIIKEIDKLDLSDKLLLVEGVWNSIAQSNQQPTLPEWQKSELNKRYDLYKSEQLELHDWQQVHEELKNRH